MSKDVTSTSPKPFIFVLMPFDSKYDDIYKFGIKGAAEDAECYAERLDEQIFMEVMLERIFNQINKADVIVADVTDRNPNVFYEVGYAHALNKIVVLITQDAKDIPFDFKHFQHIIYERSIENLKGQLTEKLIWAVKESQERLTKDESDNVQVYLNDNELSQGVYNEDAYCLDIKLSRDSRAFNFQFVISNGGITTIPEISYIYLLSKKKLEIVPCWFKKEKSVDPLSYLSTRFPFGVMEREVTKSLPIEPISESHNQNYNDGLDYLFRLKNKLPSIPPFAAEPLIVTFLLNPSDNQAIEFNEAYKLRIYIGHNFYDFPFSINLRLMGEKPIVGKS